eukprot:4074484-Prymnesium_polylepis.1
MQPPNLSARVWGAIHSAPQPHAAHEHESRGARDHADSRDRAVHRVQCPRHGVCSLLTVPVSKRKDTHEVTLQGRGESMGCVRTVAHSGLP